MERASCTVQALAVSAGIAYELAHSIAEEAGRVSSRRFKSEKLINQAKRQGIGFRKLRMGSRTLRRFLREHPVGRFYVHKRGHAFAIVDGLPIDGTRTPSQGAMILNAWQVTAQPLNGRT